MLGQFYGLIMTGGLVNDHKISFTTQKPYHAAKYMKIMNDLFNITESDLVFYLEDVQYEKDEIAIDKFKISIPNLLTNNIHIFHRPYKSEPQLTITYYSKALTHLVSNFFKQLPILLQNRELAMGFVDAFISVSKIDTNNCNVLVPNNKYLTFITSALETVRLGFEITDEGLLIENPVDMELLTHFLDLNKGRLSALTLTNK